MIHHSDECRFRSEEPANNEVKVTRSRRNSYLRANQIRKRRRKLRNTQPNLLPMLSSVFNGVRLCVLMYDRRLVILEAVMSVLRALYRGWSLTLEIAEEAIKLLTWL